MKKLKLSKEEVSLLVQENRYKLGEFVFDNISDEEKKLIIECGKSFGFEVDKSLLSGTDSSFNKYKDEYSALLLVTGKYSVSPDYLVEIENKNIKTRVLVVQQSQESFRLRTIAKKLVSEKLVTLYAGCDEEWLYESLSDTQESLMYENLQKDLPEIPIFAIKFDESGDFKVEELDTA